LDGIGILLHLPRAGDTRKFLVIDGVCDTGFTFNKIVEDLRFRDIRFTTACIVLKYGAFYEPDFHGMVLDGDHWVKILGERFLERRWKKKGLIQSR
jgi:hypoxanthine phosphoribosyltransferase